MTITYLVDGYYNPADECGVAWDDPAVEADWGLTDPILSARDQQNPGAPTWTRVPAPLRPAPLTVRPGSAGSARIPAMKLFVTGGAGFIGSNYVRHVLRDTDDEVTVYDALTYAGNLSTLRDVDDNPRFQFVKGNIGDRATLEEAMAGHDAVVHFAAESHVDRSIIGPDDFVHTNCFGTNVVMDTARRLEIGRVIHIGTDEVYGSVEVGSSKETDPLEPRSPYSASKAGSDLIALSYLSTYGAAGHRDPLHQQLRARTSTPRRSSRCSPPTCSTGRRSRSTATASTSATGSTSTTTAGPCTSCCTDGDAGRDLQHRRRQRDAQPGPGRQAAGPARGGRGEHRLRGRPAGPRPALLGRHRQDHRPGLGQAALARRGARGDGGLVPRQPLVVGTPQGLLRPEGSGAHPHHRGRRPARPRAGRRLRRPRRGRPSTTARLDVADRDAVLGAITTAAPRRHRQRRGLHRRRRLRERRRHGLGRQRPGRAPPGRRRPPGRGPGVPRLHRLRLRRHQARPLRRVGPARTRRRCTAARSWAASSSSSPDDTIVRTSWVCGYHGANMVKTILRLAAEHDTLSFVDDQRGHPDLRRRPGRGQVHRLVVDRRPGLFHVTNQGAVSWFEFAQAVLAAAGLDPDRVSPVATADLDPGPAGAPAGQLGARQRRSAPVGPGPGGRLPRAARPPGRPLAGRLTVEGQRWSGPEPLPVGRGDP